MPKETSEQKNVEGVSMFCSWERHVWCAPEGYGGANAIQSPKEVDWDLTKGVKALKQLSDDSCADKHNKLVTNIGSFYLIYNVNLETIFWTVFGMKRQDVDARTAW